MAHLPESHLALKEYVPAKVIEDAAAIGQETQRLIERLIQEASHPYLYLRRAQGIVRLRGKYGAEKVERSARVFNSFGDWVPRLRDFENMVKSPVPDDVVQDAVVRGANPNLRGLPYWERNSLH
jgi:peptidoglycan/xylan/chitin deacetylase (PgdA/CDA1 family)